MAASCTLLELSCCSTLRTKPLPSPYLDTGAAVMAKGSNRRIFPRKSELGGAPTEFDGIMVF